jgi:hypothetical protein
MVFGPEVYVNFYLFDLLEKKEKLKAFGMEIYDCCFKNVISVDYNMEKESIENVKMLIKTIDLAILLGGF